MITFRITATGKIQVFFLPLFSSLVLNIVSSCYVHFHCCHHVYNHIKILAFTLQLVSLVLNLDSPLGSAGLFPT